MAIKQIEAQLVLSGKDAGASAAVMQIVKAYEQAEKAGRGVSKGAEQVAKALLDVERQQAAVNAVMNAQKGAASAEAHLQKVRAAAGETAAALDRTRAAAKALDGQKATAGTDIARQMDAATRALKQHEQAQRAAVREVALATRAQEQQANVLRQAERAANAANVPLKALEQHQRHLAQVYDQTSEAMRRQLRVEEQAAKISAARQTRVDALKSAAGMIGLSAVHRAEHFAGHSLHTYQHFDNERRFGQVVMGLTDEQQKPLVDQAIHMGAISRYNDVRVMHAQRELAARGLNRDQVLGMIPHVKDLGQALDIDIGEAAKQVEAGIFAFKKDVSSLAAATHSAKQTADVQVKAAKISGMTPEDISQAYKYGATPARLAHVSEERMLAFAGVLKKATIGGDEAGVAFRALMSTIYAPTQGARTAMLANGMDYKNYQKAPDHLALDPFVKAVAQSYGVQLDKDARAKLGKVFASKALIADPAKFAPAIMDVLSEVLGGDDAKSKKSIAGLATRYRNASMKGVDSNKLIDDLLVKLRDNLSFANAMFGSKQGGRIATALADAETFDKMQHLLRDHSDGYASKVSEARMAGFDGAVQRFEGAITNLETKLGRAWDNDGKGGFLTDITDKAGKFVQHIAEMDDAFVRAGSAAAALGSGIVAVKSLGLLQSGFGLKGSALALDHSAAMLEAAAVKLGAGGALPDAPGGGKKGGRFGRAVGAAAGALGVGALAEAAQENGVLKGPDFSGGVMRGVLGVLDPNLPDMVLGKQAEQAGQEAGAKAGKGIADGVKAKEPEVQKEGQSILQRLQDLFSRGIYVPIHLQTDGLGGLGGAGGGGLGGLIQKASYGGGGGRGGRGGGGGSGGSGGPMPDIPSSVAMTAAERNTLGLILKYESHGRNVMNYIGDSRHTAQGYFQLTNTNWRNIAPRLGIRAPNAMAASMEDQARVAHYLLRHGGVQNWSNFNPALRGALSRGERVPSAPPTPDPPKVPDAPPILKGGHSAHELNVSIDRLGEHVDRMADMSWRSHHVVEVNASPDLRAHTTRMRMQTNGPVRGNVGISMPHTEIG